MVPTLVPKPGSPTVTQENLRGYEIARLRVLESPWVMLDREICSLKIRVSVVRCRPWLPDSKRPVKGRFLCHLLVTLRLQPKQTRVLPILGKQTLVIALFQDFAVVDDDDSVCCAYR